MGIVHISLGVILSLLLDSTIVQSPAISITKNHQYQI